MILDRILADKRTEVGARKARVPLEDLKRAARDAAPARAFARAIADGKSEIRPALRTVPPSDGAAFGRHPATCVDIPQHAWTSRSMRGDPVKGGKIRNPK